MDNYPDEKFCKKTNNHLEEILTTGLLCIALNPERFDTDILFDVE